MIRRRGQLLVVAAALVLHKTIALVPILSKHNHKIIRLEYRSNGRIPDVDRKKWDEMIPRLRQFRDIHGHTIVSKSEDPELYKWTKNLRKNYKHSSPLRRRTNFTGTALSSLSSPSSSSPSSSSSSLSSHSTSSSSTKTTTTTTATSSSSFQRTLSEDEIRVLDDLDFCWDIRALKWEHRFQELQAFQKIHGHCSVSTREYPKLGVFVQNQRREYRKLLGGNRTTLTPQRIERLQRIGFEWQRSHDERWEERYNDLVAFQRQYGHVNVPEDYAANFPLGQWVMNQRTAYRWHQQGLPTGLTKERIRKLNKLEFQWKWKESQWLGMLERLKKYQEVHGHVNVERADTKNYDLYIWLNRQRYYYTLRRGKKSSDLTDERIALLEGIPEFSWRRRKNRPSKEDWSQLFVAIREKGIAPGVKAKQHWFDGVNPFEMEVKSVWTEEELVALWNAEDDDDDDDVNGDKDDNNDSLKPRELVK